MPCPATVSKHITASEILALLEAHREFPVAQALACPEERRACEAPCRRQKPAVRFAQMAVARTTQYQFHATNAHLSSTPASRWN